MHRPHPLTNSDWLELAARPALHRVFALDTYLEAAAGELALGTYAVRFNFATHDRTWIGDLFIVQPDLLMQPIVLIRRKGRKRLVEFAPPQPAQDSMV